MKKSTIVCAVSAWVVGTSAAALQGAEEYKVDAVHSSVIFRVKHLELSYTYGRFNEITGSFSFGNRSLAIEVDAASVDTNSTDRDKHLLGADFFDTKKYSTIKFTAAEFKDIGSGKYEVSGNLTLLGVTKPLMVQLERIGSGKDRQGNARTGFETTFTIKRSEFGMTYGLGGIGDEVRLTVSIEGVAK
ncbi:MAG: YceI family protein [Phycisphaerales bacterium]|nr:MAG: YceI family protein [Phycisphaerales bacterium]